MQSGLEKHRFDVALEDLQTFLAVAEFESFSRAAEHLSLTQPAISNRIRRLEGKLMVRLLERTTRKVELTSDGEMLRLQASDTLRTLQQVLQGFHRDARKREKQIDIAATAAIAAVYLPSKVRQFQDANPDVSVRIHDYRIDEAVDLLVAGNCDIGIFSLDAAVPEITYTPLLVEECVLVTPINHPLNGQASATLEEALAYPMLIPENYAALRQAIRKVAEPRGLAMKIAPEVEGITNSLTLLAMVAAGFGCFVFARPLIPQEFRPAVGVVTLSDCSIIRSFGIMTPTKRPRRRLVDAFVQFLLASATDVTPAFSSRWS